MEKLEKKVEKIIETEALTEAQVEIIKSQYADQIANGKVKRVLLPVDELETKLLEVAVLVPSRNTISQYMRFAETQPKKAQEILINQCLLTSKERISANDELFYTCVSAIAELFPIRQATIKNF